jgi:phage anti-repressor protein/phage antirepressor YoqD-like protein
MNELIKVTNQNGKQLVSAKELYLFLGYEESQFSRFAKIKIEENQFALKDVDYQQLDIFVELPNGGRKQVKDYALTIEFAKKISMMAKTAKGEKARDYFIECETKLKEIKEQGSLPKTYLQALKQLVYEVEQKELAQAIVLELAPKAQFYDAVTESGNTYELSEACSILKLKIGRNRLFSYLRNHGILMPSNLPYRKYIDSGHFIVDMKTYRNNKGDLVPVSQTRLTIKGLDWLRKFTENLEN